MDHVAPRSVRPSSLNVALCAVLLACAGYVWVGVHHARSARAEAESMKTLSPSLTVVSYRSTISAADPGMDGVAQVTTPIDTDVNTGTTIPTRGNPFFAHAPRFSVPGATVVWRAYGWHRRSDGTWSNMGIAAIGTSKGGPTRDDLGWEAEEGRTEVKCASLERVEIRYAAPSAGTVAPGRVWLYGYDPRAPK